MLSRIFSGEPVKDVVFRVYKKTNGTSGSAKTNFKGVTYRTSEPVDVVTSAEGLAELNRVQDGVPCAVACGFAFGEKGYDLEEILTLADGRMYEDKKAGKARREAAPEN